GLPNPVDERSCGGRGSAIHEPTGEGQTIRPCAGVQRMEKRRHAGLHGLARFEKIAALEDVRLTRFLLRLQDQLRRALRVLPPKRLDLVVSFFPFRNSRSPIAEDSRGWSRRALFRGGR